jgi:MoaA/NifB/PqqE/SkfB family radical SAM enzyme
MTLLDILGYKYSRMMYYPRRTPLSLTLALTYKCNSRCKTCNIWSKKDNDNELTVDEYEKIFRSFKNPPLELVLTGGEVFAREDFVEICRLAVMYLRPKIVIIPTNGLLSEKIAEDIKIILKNSLKTKIIVNISLDGIKEDNDEIRGLGGSFERAIKTYSVLKEIKNKYLELKIHTVISNYNVDKILEIYKYVREILRTNLYIIEIAQERAELNNLGRGGEIAPSLQKYSNAVDLLSEYLEKEKFMGFSRMIQSFRLEYYQLVKRILKKKKQVIPCYAGFVSGQIAPDGDVWFCATRAESIGNLRENSYNFEKVWFSEKAAGLRRKPGGRDCYCALASIAYINMLVNLSSMLRVLIRFIKLH